MIVYWIGCLAAVLVAYLGNGLPRGKHHQKYVMFFSALPLFLIAAFRYDVGADYLRTYVTYFKTVKESVGLSYQKMEPLYHFLNQLVIWLNGSYVWIFIITAAIFLCMVYLHIYRESPSPTLSIFLLVGMSFYFVFLNAMRQMVGCAILLFSIRYIKEKKIWKYLLCVIIAACFHISCLLFLPVYWWSKIKIKPMAALILTVAVIGSSQIISSIARTIIEKTSYGVYLASVFDTGKTAYVMMAINAAVLILASIYYKENRKYQIYYNLQLIALWITVFSGKVVLSLRLLWMFGLPSIVLVPMAVANNSNPRNRKIIIAAAVIMYVVYIGYTVGIENSNSVLPYRTIFGRWIM